MDAFGPWHLLIVAAVFVALFGAKRLPDAARSMGRSARIFRSEIKALEHDHEHDATAATTTTTTTAPIVEQTVAAPVVTAPVAAPVAEPVVVATATPHKTTRKTAATAARS